MMTTAASTLRFLGEQPGLGIAERNWTVKLIRSASVCAAALVALALSSAGVAAAYPLAPNDATEQDGDVTIEVNSAGGSGPFVTHIAVGVGANEDIHFFGHWHVWDTSNGYDWNGPDNQGPAGVDLYPNEYFPVGSWICAEGWEVVNGGYVSMGRPCVLIGN